jgi:hypothetical protein
MKGYGAESAFCSIPIPTERRGRTTARQHFRVALNGTYALVALDAQIAGYGVSSIAHEPRVMCAAVSLPSGQSLCRVHARARVWRCGASGAGPEPHTRVDASWTAKLPAADGGYIFTEPDGSLILPSTVTRRFRQLVRDTGAPRVRLHDLRHSHAVHLLDAGASAKAVAARLGHSSVAFSLSKYAHATREGDERAARAVAALVDHDRR